MLAKKYTCEDWKDEFMKASKIKLNGVKSDFTEKIIYKLSPCSDDEILHTLYKAIEIYGKKK
jgi:hypothetical protein